jgi:hypothetical protein
MWTHSTEAIAATLCLRHIERPVRPKRQAARVVQVRGHLLTIFGVACRKSRGKAHSQGDNPQAGETVDKYELMGARISACASPFLVASWGNRPHGLPWCETTVLGNALGCRASLTAECLHREDRPCQTRQHENYIEIPLNLHNIFVV